MRIRSRLPLLVELTGPVGAILTAAFGRRRWTAADGHALTQMMPLGSRYLPWTSGAMRPSGLSMVLNDLALRDNRRVLECGSGISTIMIARYLRQRQGKLVSLEHDPRWAQAVIKELETEGLNDLASVVEAPLETHPEARDSSLWYSPSAVASAVASLGEIDMLLVDGPPAFQGDAWARYPAYLALKAHLSHDATVVLDDIERPAERKILRNWEQLGPINFELYFEPGGIGIGRRS